VVFPQIAKPRVFVAFSSRADKQVVGVLLDELENLTDHLRVLSWDRIDDAGTISRQLAEAISTSQFGVCYLSEPDEQGGFRDNPNVLFEAGIAARLVVVAGSSGLASDTGGEVPSTPLRLRWRPD
jgi:Predicted nucleotide-binding protein containing TIR-like domain